MLIVIDSDSGSYSDSGIEIEIDSDSGNHNHNNSDNNNNNNNNNSLNIYTASLLQLIPFKTTTKSLMVLSLRTIVQQRHQYIGQFGCCMLQNVIENYKQCRVGDQLNTVPDIVGENAEGKITTMTLLIALFCWTSKTRAGLM